MFASIFATETNIQCVIRFSLSLSFLSQIKINRPHMTTYNSLAADSGKETGLRAKSPSWNDLRCLTKGREGPALDGAYLSGCQVFKLPRSGCIPELGITKSLYKHMSVMMYYISACSWFKLALLSYSLRNKFPNTTCPYMSLNVIDNLSDLAILWFRWSQPCPCAFNQFVPALILFITFKRCTERCLVFKNSIV